MLLFELQYSRKHTCPSVTLRCIWLVGHNRAEAEYPPSRGGLRIFKQTRRRCRRESCRTVDLCLGGAARETLIGIQFQLAWGVITPMAYETAMLQERSNLVLIVGCRRSCPNSSCCLTGHQRQKEKRKQRSNSCSHPIR